jgi:phosphoribosyl 1,2-cyclic phosphodiesterase
MKLEVLASGSAANCYILSAGEDKLILDCGVKFRTLQEALDFDYSGVSACLLSHEHKDHSKAIKNVFDAGITVVTSEQTIYACNIYSHRVCETKLEEMLLLCGPENKRLWYVMPITTQHDAVDPYGFFIIYIPTWETVVYATDTYYLKYSFKGHSLVNYWLIECNYCTDRLHTQYEAGEIDTGLYRRLLQSHMSLEHLKDYLATQDLKKARKIVLLHLSDARSDEKRMEREIFEQTKVETVAAKAGLTVELELYPF